MENRPTVMPVRSRTFGEGERIGTLGSGMAVTEDKLSGKKLAENRPATRLGGYRAFR
jgi:hypothetical protein